MRLRIEKVSIEGITRADALALRNEIVKATGGKLHFDDGFDTLELIYDLLSGAFESSVVGVHVPHARSHASAEEG